MNQIGGIDIGGTKIEASLFDEHWNVIETRRIPTPIDSYETMMDGLVDQIGWLGEISHAAWMPLGIGIPGLMDRKTGHMLTANLPASGHPLLLDLTARASRQVTIINDCRAFTLSEARLGAGRDFRSVVGLVVGTGLAGGLAIDGTLAPTLNGMAGEYGHIPMPATLVSRFGLPVVACGCGRQGCYETFCSGPGLSALCHQSLGRTESPADIASGVAAGDAELIKVYEIWLQLLADLIANLMTTLDPECVVLGGGLSKIPGLPDQLTAAVSATLFPGTQSPFICIAQGGDSSGTRGAALAAAFEQMDARK